MINKLLITFSDNFLDIVFVHIFKIRLITLKHKHKQIYFNKRFIVRICATAVGVVGLILMYKTRVNTIINLIF